MKKYFARLYNNQVGMFNLMRFESIEVLAKHYADNHAKISYKSYESTDGGLCWAEIEEYNPKKHDEYFAHIKSKEFEIILL